MIHVAFFLCLISCFPAMAWGLVYDDAYSRRANLLTFLCFVGPFLISVLLFMDAMTFGIVDYFI